jgi:organic radical activating enzyme
MNAKDDQRLLFPVVELFESVQGEGANAGLLVSFLRLGGCNLSCQWCDTDSSVFQMMDIPAILKRLSAFRVRRLILTGGEPLIHPSLETLLASLKESGYWIALETNGLINPISQLRRFLDYIATSPKAHATSGYQDDRMIRHADEVRIVVDGDVFEFCKEMRAKIEAKHYFLSPCFRDGKMNVSETLSLLKRLNTEQHESPWRLSLQTHKLIGVP